MHYKVRHQTRYLYSEEVSLSHSLLSCEPRHTEFQQCLHNEVWIDPLPHHFEKRRDALGNWVGYFSLEQPHRELTVVSRSLVQVDPRPLQEPQGSWDELARRLLAAETEDDRLAHQFLYASPYVPESPQAREYASVSFPPGRRAWDAVLELNHRIHKDFRYVPGSTAVHTPIAQVFAQRRGVCQDFAHVMLACLRGQGLAARYVSGYLLTTPPPGQSRLIGADASHAWVSVWFPEYGWWDFDPTNDTVCGEQHIVLAWGRDYHEVAPLRGVVLGGGRQKIEVSVDVAPVDPA